MKNKRKHKFEVGDLVDYYNEIGIVVESGHDDLESWQFPQEESNHIYYIRIKHPHEDTAPRIFEGTSMWKATKLLAQGKSNGT